MAHPTHPQALSENPPAARCVLTVCGTVRGTASGTAAYPAGTPSTMTTDTSADPARAARAALYSSEA